MERPTFDFPVHPVSETIMNPNGATAQEKIDKIDMYIWKKDYELVHSRKAEFTKKWVFPMILDQCFPSLRSQLEEAIFFEET